MSGPTQKIKLQLPNAASVWVEVESLGSREVNVAASDFLRESFSVEAVRDTLEGMALMLVQTLDKLKPTEASIEFGLKFVLESGNLTSLLAKGSGEADFKVTLTWKQ